MSERIFSEGFRGKAKVFAFGMLAGGLAVSMVNARQDGKENGAVDEVKVNFMSHGKCLDDTIYDTSKGAVIDFTEVGDTNIVRIMPKAPNTHNPSVLLITEADNGWYGFADNRTGAFLVKQECEDIPTGY